MRLKFIFFPIVLVVSITVFATSIWPQIGEVKTVNEEKNTKKEQLQTIATKQAAIDSLGKKITDDSAGGGIVKEYLPEKKIEERIISDINFLASDSNLSLVDVSLSSQEAAAPVVGATDPVTGLPLEVKPIAVRAMSAKISVSGEYEKIRTFINVLAHMSIYNTVKSLNILKQTAEEKEGETIENNLLIANIVVEFGHMDIAKADVESVNSFKEGLDTETIGALGKYISQKSQPIGSPSDVKGRMNPFVAN